MEMPKTLQDAIVFFSDDLICVEFVAMLRWNGEPVCIHCGSESVGFLKTRKIFKCKNKECRKQFSVKVGTIFEDSPISLGQWLTAIWLIANAKNGISSYELHRAIGITQKSAWFVLHRIRIAMQAGSFEKLSGEVEADETYVGGLVKNMHASKRKSLIKKGHTVNTFDHKTAVFGMVQRGGEVRAKVVERTRREDLLPLISENIEFGSNLYTDQATVYKQLREQYLHETVNHAVEYVRDHIHTNGIENFWSLLKRTIKGTYVSVAPEHLQKYVEEQSFRYNERKGKDQDRFIGVLKSVSGKRLTYNQLTGLQSEGH
jgi:transposase-like protein